MTPYSRSNLHSVLLFFGPSGWWPSSARMPLTGPAPSDLFDGMAASPRPVTSRKRGDPRGLGCARRIARDGGAGAAGRGRATSKPRGGARGLSGIGTPRSPGPVGGILERHPRLRMVMAEAGTGWLPWLVQELDYRHWRFGLSLSRSQTSPKTQAISSDFQFWGVFGNVARG
jgi:hypothetical protein